MGERAIIEPASGEIDKSERTGSSPTDEWHSRAAVELLVEGNVSLTRPPLGNSATENPTQHSLFKGSSTVTWRNAPTLIMGQRVINETSEGDTTMENSLESASMVNDTLFTGELLGRGE